MNRLAGSTQQVQINYFTSFMKWLKIHGGIFKDYTPDQLIEYQKKHKDYEIIDLVQSYILSCEGTFNTQRSRYTNIRSFFKHNKSQLPDDPGFNLKPTREKTIGTLSPEDIRKIIIGSNLAYQATFLIMFQAGLDQESFTYWNDNTEINELKKQLAEAQGLPRESQVIKVNLPDRKRSKNKNPLYSFFTSDAIDALINYLESRPQTGESIILNKYDKRINKNALRHYWIGRLRRVGLIPPVKKGSRVEYSGKNLHEIRDVFRSLWFKTPAKPVVGEYCLGHQVDKREYDKSIRDVEYYRDEYLKAAPWLNLLTNGAAFELVEKTEIDAQNRRIKDLEIKLEVALINQDNDMQKQLSEQQQMIDMMQKSLEAINRRDAERRSPKTSPSKNHTHSTRP